jgi:hypothetical protein
MDQDYVGTIQWLDMGPGVWALVTEQGETYELEGIGPELEQVGLAVKIQGQVQENVMTLAMVGPVLVVESYSYEILDSPSQDVER